MQGLRARSSCGCRLGSSSIRAMQGGEGTLTDISQGAGVPKSALPWLLHPSTATTAGSSLTLCRVEGLVTCGVFLMRQRCAEPSVMQSPSELPVQLKPGTEVCKHHTREEGHGSRAGRISQVCSRGASGLFGTEVSDKLGNKVVVIGQEGENACSVHRSQRGWLGSGQGEQCRRSLKGACGSGACQKVLLCHGSKQVGWEAGRELGRAGVPWGCASWEGQAGHVRTRETALGACLLWPCCSVSTGEWEWESSELCGDGVGKGLGPPLLGWGV